MTHSPAYPLSVQTRGGKLSASRSSSTASATGSTHSPSRFLNVKQKSKNIFGPPYSLSVQTRGGKLSPTRDSNDAQIDADPMSPPYPLSVQTRGGKLSVTREVEDYAFLGGIRGNQIGLNTIPSNRRELASITAAEVAPLAGTTAKFNDGDVEPAKLDRTYAEHPVSYRLAVQTGIDMTAIGTTNLVTVPSGETYHITGAIVECESATDIDTEASAGIGVAAGEDDVFNSVPIVGLTVAGKIYRFLDLQGIVVSASSTIKFGVDIGATGVGSPAQLATVHLLGYKT